MEVLVATEQHNHFMVTSLFDVWRVSDAIAWLWQFQHHVCKKMGGALFMNTLIHTGCTVQFSAANILIKQDNGVDIECRYFGSHIEH